MLPLIAVLLLAAEPTELADRELLQTFRDEFMQLTPGEGKFPRSYQRGRATGGSDFERPVHEVTLARPFAIAKYEVPQNLWQRVMGNNPSRWKGARNSVEMITHADAIEFCRKATTRMRELKLIAADETIRLPTEAEWEYAARAGTTTVYSFGDDAAKLDEYGWHTGNAAGNDPPVGAKKPNPWGLYDLHGYLWEFCADGWQEDYAQAPRDGSAAPLDHKAAKPRVVLRGGSWKDAADQLTSTARRGISPKAADDAVGFRCVLAKE